MDMLLGKQTGYSQTYNPEILYPVARSEKRQDIPYNDDKIEGCDVWVCYEVSCLDMRGKPMTFIGLLSYTSHSNYIIESKSLKLYLNSFNMTEFNDATELENLVIRDLSNVLGCAVVFYLFTTKEFNKMNPIRESKGCNFDLWELKDDVELKYEVDSDILVKDENEEEIHFNSELLRSNCLVTGQPDWGTIEIYIKGEVPTAESLLRYIISFRNHQEFHEQIVERIISTLLDKFEIEECFVKCNYVRRGGIDINPIRCYNMQLPIWARTYRQ